MAHAHDRSATATLPSQHTTSDGDGTANVLVTAARAHERDLYLSALLSPRDVRDDLITLAAFVGDVSRIPVYVSDPMIGEIRLQWWRDTLEAGLATGASSGNPVADATVTAARAHDLPQDRLMRIIDAQALALYNAPPRDEMELRQHVADIYGSAFSLAAQRIDRDGTRDWATWVRDAGIAYGIARLALEYPAIRAQGRLLAPATWGATATSARGDTSKAATPLEAPPRQTPDAFVANDTETDADDDAPAKIPQPPDDVADAKRLAATATDMFSTLTGARIKPPRTVRLACRPLAMVPPYAGRVSNRGAIDPSELTVADDVSPLRRVWTLWRARL